MVRFSPSSTEPESKKKKATAAPPSLPPRPRGPTKGRPSYSEIRAQHAATVLLAGAYGSVKRTMDQLCVSRPTVRKALAKIDLRKTNAKTSVLPGHSGRGIVLAESHPAVLENRTLFPKGRVAPEPGKLLKSGVHSGKIGAVILKGKWAGYPVYTLTLEERATCPPCVHKLNCYGNNSPFSRRIKHGPQFEWMLEREVAGLELAHPLGFAVRLHALGDFYSWGYVNLWRTLMERHQALHVWGYTAHIDADGDVIARTLAIMVREFWPRFAMRFSNGEGLKMTTVSIDRAADRPADAIICPAQLQQSESCSTCALCWQSTARIAFLKH